MKIDYLVVLLVGYTELLGHVILILCSVAHMLSIWDVLVYWCYLLLVSVGDCVFSNPGIGGLLCVCVCYPRGWGNGTPNPTPWVVPFPPFILVILGCIFKKVYEL